MDGDKKTRGGGISAKEEKAGTEDWKVRKRLLIEISGRMRDNSLVVG
jgi:hypothetical protein